MKIALVQRHTSHDRKHNVERGLAALEEAARAGVVLVARNGRNAFDCSPVIDADGTLVGRTRMVHITDYAGFHERSYYSPGDRGVRSSF